MASKKSDSLMDALEDLIAIRLPTLTRTRGKDSDNCPTLLVGAAATTNPGAFIRILPQDWTSKNVLGSPGQEFSPQVIQIAVEATADPSAATGSVNSIAVQAELIAACTKQGAACEVYASNNGTAPVIGTLVVANLKARIPNDPYWGVVIGT